MRLFITGGSGFIGKALIRHLCTWTTVELIAHARKLSDNALNGASEFPCLKWVLTNSMADVAPSTLQHVDTLVHLAATGVSPQKASRQELFRVNVLDSLRLWETAVDAGVRRLIIVGSCYEYGKSGERFAAIPPSAPLEPTTSYGASKAAASIAAIGMAREKSVSVEILRPFHVFGAGQNEANLWPSLCDAALNGRNFKLSSGEQLRDFVSVEEVAAQISSVLNCADLEFGMARIRNLGSGQPQKLRDFATYWWRRLNAAGELEFGGVPYRKSEVMRFVPETGTQHVI